MPSAPLGLHELVNTQMTQPKTTENPLNYFSLVITGEGSDSGSDSGLALGMDWAAFSSVGPDANIGSDALRDTLCGRH